MKRFALLTGILLAVALLCQCASAVTVLTPKRETPRETAWESAQ